MELVKDHNPGMRKVGSLQALAQAQSVGFVFDPGICV